MRLKKRNLATCIAVNYPLCQGQEIFKLSLNLSILGESSAAEVRQRNLVMKSNQNLR